MLDQKTVDPALVDAVVNRLEPITARIRKAMKDVDYDTIETSFANLETITHALDKQYGADLTNAVIEQFKTAVFAPL